MPLQDARSPLSWARTSPPERTLIPAGAPCWRPRATASWKRSRRTLPGGVMAMGRGASLAALTGASERATPKKLRLARRRRDVMTVVYHGRAKGVSIGPLAEVNGSAWIAAPRF